MPETTLESLVDQFVNIFLRRIYDFRRLHLFPSPVPDDVGFLVDWLDSHLIKSEGQRNWFLGVVFRNFIQCPRKSLFLHRNTTNDALSGANIDVYKF